jgi:hypothetical protein
VTVIALVPALIGTTGGASLGHGLIGGYQPAMIVMAALCGIGALVAAAFVAGRPATVGQAVNRPGETTAHAVANAALAGPTHHAGPGVSTRRFTGANSRLRKDSARYQTAGRGPQPNEKEKES